MEPPLNPPLIDVALTGCTHCFMAPDTRLTCPSIPKTFMAELAVWLNEEQWQNEQSRTPVWHSLSAPPSWPAAIPPASRSAPDDAKKTILEKSVVVTKHRVLLVMLSICVSYKYVPKPQTREIYAFAIFGTFTWISGPKSQKPNFPKSLNREICTKFPIYQFSKGQKPRWRKYARTLVFASDGAHVITLSRPESNKLYEYSWAVRLRFEQQYWYKK